MTNFSNLNKLNKNDFDFIQINNTKSYHGEFDGTISLNNKVYYFKFSHAFDEGNNYIVYDVNNNPISYFIIKFGEKEENDLNTYFIDDNGKIY